MGWIKMETDLRHDLRVRKMARALAEQVTPRDALLPLRVTDSVTLVLGGLAQLWMHGLTFADQDDTMAASLDDIDEITGIKGFAQLIPADWLEVLSPERVKLPHFHAHNGTSAKARTLSAERQARYRARQASQNGDDTPSRVTRHGVTGALPEQNRRRTEDLLGEEPLPPSAGRPPRRKRERTAIKPDAEPTEADRAYALAHGPHDADWGSTWNNFRDHHIAKGTLSADWSASWRTWVQGIATRGFNYARRRLEPGARPAAADSPRLTRQEAERVAAGESVAAVVAERPAAVQPAVVASTPRLPGESVSAWIERAKPAGGGPGGVQRQPPPAGG